MKRAFKMSLSAVECRRPHRAINKSMLVVGALLSASCVTAAQAQVAVTGDPVLYWNQIAIQNIDGDPGIGGRAYAIVNIAVHDAVNATLGSPDHSYLGTVANGGGDTRAAVAVAAHDVLVNLYPTKAAAFDAALASSLDVIGASSAKTAGAATGAAFASAALASRANDGFNNPFPAYVPTGQPGNYVPTSPPIPAIDGQFATATPFVLSSPSQFRPGPPPDLTSAAYTAAFKEVKLLGAANSTDRSADQTFSAQFWEGVPETPYLTAAITQSVATGKSVLDNARIFATLTTAIADAPIAAFDAKYLYNFWRPVTAIQQADIDGNPLTEADPNWQSLLFTPPFPSYFSAHSIVAGTAASILDQEYGSSIGFCFTNTVGERCWASYDAAAQDDALSRLWGGVHFSFDNDVGLSTGHELGEFALAQNIFSAAAPEPATWMMMIAGFGLIGVTLRRRPEGARVAYS